jgi:hypothetical protein
MTLATNQTGFQIERLDSPRGWTSILDVPFTNRAMAVVYMDGMPRVVGSEYRIYAALKGRST